MGFVWPFGMGMAIPCQGESFHGVLQKQTYEEIRRLDKIEFAYKRIPATAIDYDGNEIQCSVYS